MREWYRQKLRELARVDERVKPQAEEPRDILSLTGDVEPGDRQLGDLLRSLQLVDSETLTALLVEARKQRRSLRQLLLAGGYLTLYQMALIEAGNLDGLVLGPVRVIDRLRATPHEIVYRVFDPRSNEEAVLRHLTEAELRDAAHLDEFRQCFTQAIALRHPNLSATLEVLDIAGRPAVLLESCGGLPSTDWPALTSAPGVWYRLVTQTATGLHAAHEAGMVHGHLNAQAILMTADGTLKIAGFGEPDWLTVPPVTTAHERDASGDLSALGRLATEWAQVETTKPNKIKLPPPLQKILKRLTGEGAKGGYATAAELLEDLDSAGSAVPANATAWERFVRQVREQCGEEVPTRKSA
jgi:hypothetical protein